MSKTAIHNGYRWNVVEEGEKYITLEGAGYTKRALKEDVILEEPETEELATEQTPSSEVITDAPEDTLSSEAPDKDLIDETTMEQQKAAEKKRLADIAAAKAAEEKAKADKLALTKSALEEESGWDPYAEYKVAVDSLKLSDVKDENEKRMKGALKSLRERVSNILSELDDVLEEDISKIEEEGEGAGAGTTTAAVENFNARINLGLSTPERRKETYSNLEEAIVLPSVLNEGVMGGYNLNRHLICDKIESRHCALNEAEGCTIKEARKARVAALGERATLAQCAKYISENEYSCSEGKYVPRVNKLDENAILKEMRALAGRAIRKIKNI
jgi:hypothetical protein